MTNWWPFRKKRDPAIDTEEAFRAADYLLAQEVAGKLVAGVSRQAILHQVETKSNEWEQRRDSEEKKVQLRVLDMMHSRLKNDLLHNLSEGKNHEMAGRVDAAIECYETAVADQVATRFPYEHLRVIYRQRGQVAEALRVCQTAVNNPFLGYKDVEHFQNWVKKLQTLGE